MNLQISTFTLYTNPAPLSIYDYEKLLYKSAKAFLRQKKCLAKTIFPC